LLDLEAFGVDTRSIFAATICFDIEKPRLRYPFGHGPILSPRQTFRKRCFQKIPTNPARTSSMQISRYFFPRELFGISGVLVLLGHHDVVEEDKPAWL